MDSKHFLILTSIIFFSAPLWGDTYTVSSEADAGPGSLRQAILDLNETGNTATNTITINSGLPPILLTSKLPVIQRTATITTSGTVPQIIDGNQNRLFVANANLTIENCNIQNGAAIGGNGISGQSSGGGGGLGAGGGVYVAPNTVVTLNNTSLNNNLAQGGKGASGFQNLKGGGFSGSGGGASFSSADPNASRTQGGGDNPGQHGSMGNPVAGGGNKGGKGGLSNPGFIFNDLPFNFVQGVPARGLGRLLDVIGGISDISRKFINVSLTPNFNIINGQSGSSSGNLRRGGGDGGDGGSTTNGIYEFLSSDEPVYTGEIEEGGVDGGAGGIGGAGGGGGGGAYVAQPPTLFEQAVSPFEDEIGYSKIQLVSQPGNGGDEVGGGGAAGNLRNGGDGGGYGSGGGGGSTSAYSLATPKKERGATPGLPTRTFAQTIAQLVPLTGFGSGGGGGGFGGGGGGGGGDLTLLSGEKVEYISGGGGGFKFVEPIIIVVGRKIPFQGGGGGGGGGFGGGGGGNAAFLQEDVKDFPIFEDGRVSQGGKFGGAGGGQAQQTKPYAGSGGGGAGIGGAVFVGNNAQLVIQDSVSLSGNQSQGGEPGTDSVGSDIALPAGHGFGLADDIFLHSNTKLVFQNENSLLADFSIQSDPENFQNTVVRKEGSGTVTMTSQENNYRGTTVIKEGTIAIASDVLGFPTSQLVFAGGTLEATDTFSLKRLIILDPGGTIAVNPSCTLTVTTPFVGEGSLTKTDEGTLVLLALFPPSFPLTGNLIIDDGIVIGDTSGIQRDVLINKLGTLVFDQNFEGVYEGRISGNGTLYKDGIGRVSFIGSDDFSGSTNIIQGALVVPEGERFSSDYIFLESRAVLKNNGTITANLLFTYGTTLGSGTFNVKTINNRGRLRSGNSIGTLTINGNYVQDPSGTLGIEIDATGAANLLNVTGTATLDGNVDVTLNPGVYLKGTTYTFLTAGAVTGQFSSLFGDPLNYTINYLPNQAQLFLTASSVILGIPNSSLTGNARSVAGYLFCDNFDFANTDLIVVANKLIQLPINEYTKALNSLTPAAFGSLPLVELENNFNLANTFFVAGVGQRSYCYKDIDEPTNVWFNPLGFVYSQDGHKEAPGFTAHTYGAVVGADRVFLDEWSLGVGFGYSHAQLDWKHQVGHAHADSIYLGPYVKYDSENFYFDFLLLGAGNFYDVDRKIVFPGFSRKAHSDPTTWNLSEILLAGFRLEPFDIDNFFVQPEIRLDQTNSFQEKFKETGAQSLDLSVKDKRSSFLRSLVSIKVVKESCVSGFCLVPSINIGWLRTTPLIRGHYASKFREGTFCKSDFVASSFHQTIDQLLVGAQFLVSRQGDIQLSIGYEGFFGKKSTVNEINMNACWSF
ncbi:Autotransporter beta-domain [Candidatus Rhabdochlamydia oedothoracis]|uniref:Autotransporter beta-domain n=1 Tax=Candidatus Rhabdochlamydia oedothoracis TaxID=2720720 RepID=A0ABX8UYN7_9BACT|nr:MULTISPECIES: autotransporter outer membrane beta-barrel domain-containing protein [Rhabdochlamydia]KAG6558983.1 Adhesin BmaC autotransporter [Candidatus Rhabdochlamydia sp. W815]QYF48074.1 Autotransporter beta-domain [Candidatus Rhabdochlamydia oedothoracis]